MNKDKLSFVIVFIVTIGLIILFQCHDGMDIPATINSYILTSNVSTLSNNTSTNTSQTTSTDTSGSTISTNTSVSTSSETNSTTNSLTSDTATTQSNTSNQSSTTVISSSTGQTTTSVTSNTTVSTTSNTTTTATTTTTNTTGSTTNNCPPAPLPVANYQEKENVLNGCNVDLNGTCSTAESSSITLSIGSTYTFAGWSQNYATGYGRYDYIAFIVNSTCQIKVSVYYGVLGTGHDVDFYLMNSTCGTALSDVATEATFPATVDLGVKNINPGLYYLKTTDFGTAAQVTDYKFTVSCINIPPCPPGALPIADFQETENVINGCSVDLNGSCSSAENSGQTLNIGVGKTFSGWTQGYNVGNGIFDFISFTLSSTSAVTMSVNYGNQGSPHNVDFSVRRTDCSYAFYELDAETTFPVNRIVGSTVLSPGLYYVRIYDRGSTDETTDYKITLTASTPPVCPPASLPVVNYQEIENVVNGCYVDLNGSCSNAENSGQTIAIGNTRTFAGWSQNYNPGNGLYDYISFTLSATSLVKMGVNYGNFGTPHNVDFSLRRADCSYIFYEIDAETTFPVNRIVGSSILLPGVYYIRTLDSGSINSITDYLITITASLVVCPPATLPAADYQEAENRLNGCNVDLNGSCSLAESSSINLTIGSTKTIAGWSEYYATGNGLRDYIAFKIATTSQVTFNVNYGNYGFTHDIDIYLLSSTCSTILSDMNIESTFPATLSLGIKTLSPGVYYLATVDYGSTFQITDYKFTLECRTVPICPPGVLPVANYQETENVVNGCLVDFNGSCSSAENSGLTLNIGGTRTFSGWSQGYSTGNGVYDYISFILSTNSLVDMSVIYGNLGIPHNVDFSIRKPDCTYAIYEMDVETTFPVNRVVGSAVLPAGTYYVRAWDQDANENITDYKIILTASTPPLCPPTAMPVADYQEAENRVNGCMVDLNGTCSSGESSGLTLTIGSSKTLSGWSERFDTGNGRNDYISLIAPTSCQFTVSVIYGNYGTPHDVDFFVLNGSCTSIINNQASESTFPATISIGTINVNSGIYYFRAFDYGNISEITDYKFVISCTTSSPCPPAVLPTADYQEAENRLNGCMVDLNGTCSLSEPSGINMTIGSTRTISGWSERYDVGNGRSDSIYINAATSSQLTINVIFGNLGTPHDVDFYVLNGSCTTLLSNQATDTVFPMTQNIGSVNVNSGTYILRTLDWGTTNQITDYKFVITCTSIPPCPPGTLPAATYQEAENRLNGCNVDLNGSCTLAESSSITLTIGASRTISGWSQGYSVGNGTNDYIKFLVPSNSLITVNANYGNLGNAHNLDFAIVSSSCNYVFYNYNAETVFPSTVLVGTSIVPAGTYILQVADSDTTGIITDYKISMTATTIPAAGPGQDCSNPINISSVALPYSASGTFDRELLPQNPSCVTLPYNIIVYRYTPTSSVARTITCTNNSATNPYSFLTIYQSSCSGTELSCLYNTAGDITISGLNMIANIPYLIIFNTDGNQYLMENPIINISITPTVVYDMNLLTAGTHVGNIWSHTPSVAATQDRINAGTTSCGGNNSTEYIYWYRVPGGVHSIDVRTCNSTFGIDSIVWVGTSAGGDQLGCNDDFAGCGASGYLSQIQSINVTNNLDVYITVDSWDYVTDQRYLLEVVEY